MTTKLINVHVLVQVSFINFFYEKKFFIMKALIFLVFEHIFIESSIIKSTHAYAHVHTHHSMKFSVCGMFVDD